MLKCSSNVFLCIKIQHIFIRANKSIIPGGQILAVGPILLLNQVMSRHDFQKLLSAEATPEGMFFYILNN